MTSTDKTAICVKSEINTDTDWASALWCRYLGGYVVNIILLNYSIHSPSTSCACLHMQGGKSTSEELAFLSLPFKKRFTQSQVSAAILLAFRAVKAILWLRWGCLTGIETLQMNMKAIQKCVFNRKHSTNSYDIFTGAFLCVLDVAITVNTLGA